MWQVCAGTVPIHAQPGDGVRAVPHDRLPMGNSHPEPRPDDRLQSTCGQPPPARTRRTSARDVADGLARSPARPGGRRGETHRPCDERDPDHQLDAQGLAQQHHAEHGGEHGHGEQPRAHQARVTSSHEHAPQHPGERRAADAGEQHTQRKLQGDRGKRLDDQRGDEQRRRADQVLADDEWYDRRVGRARDERAGGPRHGCAEQKQHAARGGRLGLVQPDDRDPGEAEQRPDQATRGEALAEERARGQHDEHRLQVDDRRRRTGGHGPQAGHLQPEEPELVRHSEDEHEPEAAAPEASQPPGERQQDDGGDPGAQGGDPGGRRVLERQALHDEHQPPDGAQHRGDRARVVEPVEPAIPPHLSGPTRACAAWHVQRSRQPCARGLASGWSCRIDRAGEAARRGADALAAGPRGSRRADSDARQRRSRAAAGEPARRERGATVAPLGLRHARSAPIATRRAPPTSRPDRLPRRCASRCRSSGATGMNCGRAARCGSARRPRAVRAARCVSCARPATRRRPTRFAPARDRPATMAPERAAPPRERAWPRAIGSARSPSDATARAQAARSPPHGRRRSSRARATMARARPAPWRARRSPGPRRGGDMPEADALERVWIGKDEYGGIPVPPRKDLPPPPHWRLEAIVHTPRPRSLDVSRDRRRAVFVEDGETSDLWLLDLEAPAAVPERLTVGREPHSRWEDAQPRFSPDGATIAYTDAGHVWLVPTAGGVARKLVAGGSPVWFDDRRLVVSVEHEIETTHTTRLTVVDVDDRFPRRLATTHDALEALGDEDEAVVSPDGAEVAYVFRPRADLNRAEIRVVEVVTGRVRALTGTPGMQDGAPAWSPDAATIVYVSERSGWRELHAVGRGGGDNRQLTDERADVSDAAWQPDGRRIAAVLGRRNRFDLVLVDAASGAVDPVAAGGAWSRPQWTAAGDLAVGYEDHATPAELRRVAPRVADSDRADRGDRSPLSGASGTGDPVGARAVGEHGPAYTGDGAGAAWEARAIHTPAALPVRRAPHVAPEEVAYPSFDGLEIPAFLFRPREASGERPVAAIVAPHGGPTAAYIDEHDAEAQYFVDKGYAWLAPNFRGSTGYGRDFERLDHGVWGVDDTKDCLAAADYLRTLDWVDGERLAIAGGSYGSYMAVTAVAADAERRFRCAVALYGDVDILTSWAQGDRLGAQDLERMMGHPSTARAAYRTGSPVHRLENIQAPLLIAHGERDERVDPRQSEELVAELRRLGKTFEYLTYPTAGHGFRRAGPRLHFLRRLERFLDWYLL